MKNKPTIFYVNLSIIVGFSLFILFSIFQQYRGYQLSKSDFMVVVAIFIAFVFMKKKPAVKTDTALEPKKSVIVRLGAFIGKSASRVFQKKDNDTYKTKSGWGDKK